MFGKLLRMDFKRGASPAKVIPAILIVVVLMAASSWDTMLPAIQNDSWGSYGAVDLLEKQMLFDAYKVVMVISFAAVYTGSICKDIRSRYQRMILSRTNLQAYTASRFLVNAVLIIIVSIISCYLYSAVIMIIGFPVITENAEGGLLGSAYYLDWMKAAPYLYIGFIGLQFGIIAAAFSSIGLLFSAYQQDAFVCIGLSAFSFFIAVSVSAFWTGNPFDLLTLMGMQPTLPSGRNTPLPLMCAWGMLYPSLIIILCCLAFYRKMKERVVNGII